jgi:chemotaxis protein histidine kinase CheA
MAMTDKVLEENDIKVLEEEIDSAVDRLFVDKKGTPTETISMPPQSAHPPKPPETPKPPSPPKAEQAFQVEKDFDFESPAALPPPAFPSSKSFEKMEGQLLSLEWEINRENLAKTREEVHALRETLKETPEVSSILSLMDKVLDYMVKNEEKIQPPLVTFLMDSKETLRLMMRKEADSELNIYKQLAYAGIQARYSCLEELKDKGPERPVPSSKEEIEKTHIIVKMDNQIGEISKKMSLFLEKLEELRKKMDLSVPKGQPVSTQPQPSGPITPVRSMPMDVTVLKVEERFLGVDSTKIYKLFKVPSDQQAKYSDQQKIRLKDVDARLIDLRKIFSAHKGDRKGEIRILAVNADGECKGLMIDQVLEKLSTSMESGGKIGDYFAGIIHWTYRDRPIEIPVLDLKKL